MARRRKTRRKRKTTRWPADLEFDVLCEFLLGDFGDDAFSSLEEKRAAWEHYRDALMPDAVASWPGERPAVWWQFDSPEPRNHDAPEWEQLLRLGQMEPPEIGAVRKGWLEDLRKITDSLRYVFHYHRQGLVRYCGYVCCDWQAACTKIQREAALLGSDTTAAWGKMKNYITENANDYYLARAEKETQNADDGVPSS